MRQPLCELGVVRIRNEDYEEKCVDVISLSVYFCICSYICIYICVCISMFVFISISIFISVSIFVSISVCMFICIHQSVFLFI